MSTIYRMRGTEILRDDRAMTWWEIFEAIGAGIPLADLANGTRTRLIVNESHEVIEWA